MAKGRKRQLIQEDDEEEQKQEVNENHDEFESDEDEFEHENNADDLNDTSNKRSKKSSTSSGNENNSNSNSNANYFHCVNAQGKQAEAGIIHKVTVENFMCHRKLTVNLCRNVNFIHGQNGSGKSAILAAIQICLGAGAKRTHRARNLQDLVRKESQNGSAKVRVTLLNQGPEGFQSEIYGDYITVERHISLKGGSGYNGYKILDARDKEISRSRKDLDALLDHLNIQVENPVAVLDQEEAKKFLMGKPEDKYAFFVKATELERLDRVYASVKDTIQDLKARRDTVQQSLQPSIDNTKQLKAEWEQYQALEKMEKKVSILRLHFSWSLFHQHHNKLNDELERLQEIDTKMQKRQDELDAASQSLNNNQNQELQIQLTLQQLSNEANNAAILKHSLEQQVREASLPIKEQDRFIQAIARDLHFSKKKIQSATQELHSVREEIRKKAGSAQSEETKRMELMDKEESLLQQSKVDLEQNEANTREFLKKYEELEPREEAFKNQEDALKRQMYAIQKKVQEMKQSEGNSLAVFGGKCVEMYKKVEQAKRQGKFRGKVIGPIGAHLKLVPSKRHLAPLAELSLGSRILQRFIVTNDADRSTFMKLRTDIGCSPYDCNVFQIRDGSRYHVKAPPDDQVETIATVLQISDDLVYNCLVDMAAIDQIALLPDRETSERLLLLQGQDGKSAIRGNHIRQVFFLPRGDFWQVQRGNLTMISNERKLKLSIGVDQSEAIKEAESDLSQLTEEMNELKVQSQDVSQQRRQLKINWNEAKRGRERAQAMIRKCESNIMELRLEAEAAKNVITDTSELEDEVKDAQEQYDALKAQQLTHERTKEELLPAIQLLETQLEEIRARNDKILLDIQQSEHQLESYLQGQVERDRNIEKKRDKVEKFKQARLKQLEVIEAYTKTKDEALQIARRLTFQQQKLERRRQEQDSNQDSDDHLVDFNTYEDASQPTEAELETITPITTNKEPEYYKAKIEREQRHIEKEKERRRLTESDPEVAFQKYRRAKEALENKMETLDRIQDNNEKLILDLKNRRMKWKQFRTHIAGVTNGIFDDMLNRKGSSGHILFDHGERKLDLIVQKNSRDEGTQTTDVKALR
jgi:chromosome segregation ATPase